MAENENERPVPQEPTVLDYVRARLMPWRGPAPEIPPLLADGEDAGEVEQSVWMPSESEAAGFSGSLAAGLPWRSLGGLALALLAQLLLMPPLHQAWGGAIFFLLAAGLVIWAVGAGELSQAEPVKQTEEVDDFRVRTAPLAAGVIVLLVAFIAFSKNANGEFLYTGLNLFLWFTGIGLVLSAIWQPRPDFSAVWEKIKSGLSGENWQVRITRHTVLVVLALAVAVFFRVYRLGEVIPEMFSDHAEKLLDVYDITQGHTKVFFERNTGREGLQFYLIAWAARWFGTGISFLSMKIGTVAFGILMLPYIYLLGKELGNKNVGLLAMFLAGVSYWPNVLARVALRFILYPAFAAPTLYYLVRGLRSGRRRDFILSGIFLGIGLHGYTPMRAVPILIGVVIVLYVLQQRSKLRLYKGFVWLGVVGFVSLMIFLPLLRVWTQAPGMFNSRTISRLTAVEAGSQMTEWWAVPGVFLNNVWNGLLMFNWDSGDIWVNTIQQAPSLDIVAGAAFMLGVSLLLVRYFTHRRWEDGLLLFGLPILMLPSTLALAFPQENPAPNRAGGAAVVVFIIAALAIEAVLRAVRTKIGGQTGLHLAASLGLGLVLLSAGHNYDLTFNTFAEQYRLTAHNTSELGAVIAQFTDTVGAPDQAWVVAYPHWVDTRLVGINAGFPIRDFAVFPEDLDQTLSALSPKLFLIKLDDQAGFEAVEALYPQGESSVYPARNPEKSFIVYYVP